jgi:hypothetical protein
MKTSIFTLALLLCLPLGYSAQPQTSSPLPQVVQHADPTYPPLARQTRISGDVHLEITTDGESVVSVAAIDGHPILRPSAEDNVRTWKFARHNPSTFFVTFRYVLGMGNVDVGFLEPPGVVRIVADPPQLIAEYANVGLGVWSLQANSRSVKFRRILELSWWGGDEESLDGRFFRNVSALRKAYDYKSDSDDEDEEEMETIGFGHREDVFVSFIVKLRRPNGRRVPTFFSGVMKGNQISGTFTDRSGETGTWTATRIADDFRSMKQE